MWNADRYRRNDHGDGLKVNGKRRGSLKQECCGLGKSPWALTASGSDRRGFAITPRRSMRRPLESLRLLVADAP
ncbi:hypothetical protein EYF80_019834 [Liparis tanakae]|uniref:Uncharacterized protein n=1 Tax=Liparis tanakae TaxID=230148 RepID=A0A4Z2HWK5_9TELE|nr:hypothetical protein EYF80_019834 [Liparis tanakae]